MGVAMPEKRCHRPSVTVAYANPATGRPLRLEGESYVDDQGASFPVVAGIPRFCPAENYATNFGKQWNLFDTTQIDGEGVDTAVSSVRLFAETGWTPQALAGLDILEVGSGAGRFSRVLVEQTEATLYSVDYSSAVEANWRNNGNLSKGRLHLAQASIYELPYVPGSFDKVLCLGVLQHTPDFGKSVAALVAMAKPGGEIVVDFYPIRGWWTKLHAKYLLRPITKRMSHDRLMRLIEGNVGWMEKLVGGLQRIGLGALARFVPLVDPSTLPPELDAEQRREWLVLDTFDMFSPAHDHPQRVATVARMFERAGARVTFAGFVDNGVNQAAVVKAVRPA